MRQIFVALIAAGVLGVAGGLALEVQAQSSSDGKSIGNHVSHMAPEHAREHRAMFGECVSQMARAGHDHETCDMEGHMGEGMGSHMNGGMGGHIDGHHGR